MKKLNPLALGAALLLAAGHANGQTINPTGAYSAYYQFTSLPGLTIGGLGTDANNNAYTIEGAFGNNARLVRRTAASGYSNATELASLGTNRFGSFVRVHSNKLYFGYTDLGGNGWLESSELDGSGRTTNALIPGIYDLAFHGTNAFVSHNPGGFFASNRVSAVDLLSGTLDAILETADYSGPSLLDGDGNLLYGATTFAGLSPNGGLYRFSAAAVTGAIGGTVITLDPPTGQIFDGGSFGSLAAGPNSGVFAYYDSAVLSLFDLTSLTELVVAGTPNSFGPLSALGTNVLVTVTDFGAGQSSVFLLIPEPGAPLLALALCAAAAALRRRRP